MMSEITKTSKFIAKNGCFLCEWVLVKPGLGWLVFLANQHLSAVLHASIHLMRLKQLLKYTSRVQIRCCCGRCVYNTATGDPHHLTE